MRRHLIIVIGVLLAVISLTAQEPPSYHTRSKKAIALFEEARKLDHAGNWFRSLDLLQEALKKDKSFDEAILLTHQILIKRGQWSRADSIYKVSEERVDEEFKNRMLLDGAFYNYSEGNYEEAQELKKQIDGEIKGIDHRMLDLVKTSIDYAVEQKKTPRKIEFTQLPAPLNNKPQQYFPSITGTDMLVFTIRDKGGRSHEDIYFSQLSETGWSTPLGISTGINSERNEGTASISSDGRTLVFTACNRPSNVGSCDLYVAYRRTSGWTRPQLLSRAINTIYWESQPSLSQDGRQLYFVSKRPDGLGGQDLWWSQKVNDEWLPAINLGEQVNTTFDDCSPYIYADGKTLFFASRGRPGFGGYDLFVIERQNINAWGEARNLGYPINSHGNQVGYTVSTDGWAYYSDNDRFGQTKLHRFRMPEDLLPKTGIASLKGRIVNAETDAYLEADVNVADLATDSTLLVTRSDEASGRFQLFIEPNEDAYLYIKKKGFLLYKANMNELFASNQEAEVRLSPLKVGDKIILNDVLFQFNSAELDIEATQELDAAVAFLKDNPEVKIEIAGHTDAQGDEEYNIKLSFDRAMSVHEYFLKKNVPKENLVFKGYGESQPLTGAEVGDQAAKNRRIELIITGIGK